ncbi:MAG: hypothetical protein IJ772_04990 [Bacilli bacterium]|nr:hypothetical protein [Bacilli bacterium]
MAAQESETELRRFYDNEPITASELADEDIFPITDMSTNEDKKLSYGNLKKKVTEDVLSNSEAIANMSDESLKTLADKNFEIIRPSIDESTQEVISSEIIRLQAVSAGAGAAVVMKDTNGVVDNMFKIPRFNLEDIDPTGAMGYGPHPAFISNGVVKDAIYVAQYQASNDGSGHAKSVYNGTPWVSINFDAAREACLAKNNGSGKIYVGGNTDSLSEITGKYHLISTWDWAAIAYWVRKMIGSEPAGNVSSSAAVGTGSGGITYAHNQKDNGIFDLVGNVWEWNDGMKQDSDGKIRLLTDNNVDKMNTSGENDWLDCGAGYATFQVSGIASGSGGSTGWLNTFKNVGNDKDEEVRKLLTAALVRPHEDSSKFAFAGSVWYNTGERMPSRGGAWGGGAIAGLAALSLNGVRSGSGTAIGFRFAFL